MAERSFEEVRAIQLQYGDELSRPPVYHVTVSASKKEGPYELLLFARTSLNSERLDLIDRIAQDEKVAIKVIVQPTAMSAKPARPKMGE